MKIKDGFILRKVAETYIVVAIGDEAISFDAMITLNDSGAFLWEQLEQETTREKVLDAFLTEYELDRETAEKDLDEFIANLQERKLLV